MMETKRSTPEGAPLISVPDLVSKPYLLPWYSKREKIVIKGSKGSGKSSFAALWLVYNMMIPEYKLASALVVRRVYDSIGTSSYQDILWAIEYLGVTNAWSWKTSPYEFTYKPTGQKILFKGLDDPIKLASTRVAYGHLCWVWFEECSQMESYEDVVKVMMSIRAIPPETGLWKRFMFTFNPWSAEHWLKKEFFDKKDPMVLAMTTTYKDNPFITDADRRAYEDLRKTGTQYSKVVCDGDWGVAEGLIYENWTTDEFDIDEVLSRPGIKLSYGLDFGYSTSYNGFVAIAVDVKAKKIWIYDEIYNNGKDNLSIARDIISKGYEYARIIADCAEPKSIRELKNGIIGETPGSNGPTYVKYALPNIRPAHKGGDSVSNGIARIQMYQIIVHTRCIHMISELSSYIWEVNKAGEFTGKPDKHNDHLCDAFRYAMEVFISLGHGYVGVAKGLDGYISAHSVELMPDHGAQRVFSTHE